jgi:hypothetical protein
MDTVEAAREMQEDVLPPAFCSNDLSLELSTITACKVENALETNLISAGYIEATIAFDKGLASLIDLVQRTKPNPYYAR